MLVYVQDFFCIYLFFQQKSRRPDSNPGPHLTVIYPVRNRWKLFKVHSWPRKKKIWQNISTFSGQRIGPWFDTDLFICKFHQHNQTQDWIFAHFSPFTQRLYSWPFPRLSYIQNVCFWFPCPPDWFRFSKINFQTLETYLREILSSYWTLCLLTSYISCWNYRLIWKVDTVLWCWSFDNNTNWHSSHLHIAVSRFYIKYANEKKLVSTGELLKTLSNALIYFGICSNVVENKQSNSVDPGL